MGEIVLKCVNLAELTDSVNRMLS